MSTCNPLVIRDKAGTGEVPPAIRVNADIPSVDMVGEVYYVVFRLCLYILTAPNDGAIIGR
jgi:hypothetical protein